MIYCETHDVQECCPECSAEDTADFYNAALNFALDKLDGDQVQIVDFLELWREGCWPEIETQYPAFDLTTVDQSS